MGYRSTWHDLPELPVRLLQVLVDDAVEDITPWTTRAELCDRLGRQPGAVRKAVRFAEQHGWVTEEKQGTSNFRYHLHRDRIPDEFSM